MMVTPGLRLLNGIDLTLEQLVGPVGLEPTTKRL